MRPSAASTIVVPAGHHDARRDAERRAAANERHVSRRLSALRLIVAGATAVVSVELLRGALPAGGGWWVLVGVGAFLGLVVAHDRVERRIRWHGAAADWHEDRRLRVARSWAALPEPWQPDLAPHHPFARDLDLFGRASVFELVGPPGTSAGRLVLAHWLLNPAAPHEICQRQMAVRELATDASFRERLGTHGRIVGQVSAFDIGTFLEWAEGARWLLSKPWLVWVARSLAASNLALLTLQGVGIIEGSWWLATVTAGLVLSWMMRQPMDNALGRATGWEPVIRTYVDWLQLAEQRDYASPYLAEIRAELSADGQAASTAIADFRRLVALADLRHNALLHFPIHALTLWDVHVWGSLERWQGRHGKSVRRWIDALARLEALVSLATLASDHPEWTEPQVATQHHAIVGVGVGHPLLRPADCVRNDVSIGPPGRVLCITGSNMSGKSTLLRALGVNLALAQAGAPVCAHAVLMPPVRMFASLRVVDSLAEGVSFFMAALTQLKHLVEAADLAGRDASSDRPLVFYALDEILQGTNSTEREAAVRIVVRHLLTTPAIGVITTHDLALTETPELRASGDHWHFRETIHESAEGFGMTFDYTLRPGVATSRNALALLRLVGLSPVNVPASVVRPVPPVPGAAV